MSSLSQKSTKSPSQSKQQPLRVTSIATVPTKEEQVQQPAKEDVLPEQNVDQWMEEQYEEEEVEEAADEATKDEAPLETTVAESKEKVSDSTSTKSRKRAALTTPPAKKQREAPSDVGSSPTSGHGEEEKGEETTTPPVVKQEKPSRSAFGRQTRSKATGKAVVEATIDISRRSVVLPKAVHMQTLEQLGITDEVQQLFDNIGWGVLPQVAGQGERAVDEGVLQQSEGDI